MNECYMLHKYQISDMEIAKRDPLKVIGLFSKQKSIGDLRYILAA